MARNLSTLLHVRLGPYQDWPIGTKLIAFLIPLIVAVTILGAWALQARNQTGITAKLTQRARSLHTQIMADREYYASVIVPRVIELGGSLGPDYRRAPGRFPLPATFVREVSELTATSREGYGANLISPWPINKDKGPTDQFQREGFAYLMRYPTGQFVRTDTMEGQVVMRVLMGDRASAQSCVDCHNAHAESPRRDFKLNDLMGGLEIVMPISQYQEEGRRDLIVIVAGGAGLCLLLLGIVTIGTHRTVTRPLATLAARMRAAASPGEDPATQAASVPSGDEVTQLTETFGRMQAVIGAQQTQLLEANAQLEDRVRERTLALRESEAQLRQSQKMEAVGQLAGGIAHDFNNLLTVILGHSQLLLSGLDLSDAQRRGVEQIKQAGDRSGLLVTQLLAFSRRQMLEPKVLNLNTLVAKMGEMLQRVLGENIEMATALEPGLGHVKADPGQLEQVIMNLAVNARDAMPGGGHLTIETKNVELDDAYARSHVFVRPGQYVMLAVTDTGCGMDAKTQARIFEPFFTTKEPGKGTGLGLATVYGIVKQSGGTIFVYSEPGRGATFKVYLPAVDQAVDAVGIETAPAEPPHGTETVLVAEDNPEVRTLVCDTLRLYGYTVLEARHGIEALQSATQHAGPIHLLVTDVVMPQMSGSEVAAHLSSQRPGMKVLYTSGYTETAIVQQGVLDPEIAFLRKPFTPKALARAVREVLDAPQKSSKPAR